MNPVRNLINTGILKESPFKISNGVKVLSIGSDRSLFNKDSAVRERIIEYGKFVEEMHIVVFSLKKRNFQFPISKFQLNHKSQISNNIFIYPTYSINKWFYIFDAYKIAKNILTANYQLLTISYLITCQDSFESGLIGWLLKKKFKIPLQIQIHTDFLSPYFWQESFLNKIRVMLAKFLILRANCVRVVSKRIADPLNSKFQVSNSKITVLPIFVDVKNIQEAPITIDLHRKYHQFDFIILIASRLTKEKNIGLAVSAMAEVVKKYSKACLVVVGKGPELENLKSQISNLKTTSQNSNFDEQIIFEDWQEKDILVSYYKTADLFLLTSNYEGYGMAVIEAMAAGCPVVMTDVGLAGEILIDKENGLVVPVNDRKKLIQAIFSLMENPELRKHLANNAKKILDFWPSKDAYLKSYYQNWAKCRS